MNDEVSVANAENQETQEPITDISDAAPEVSAALEQPLETILEAIIMAAEGPMTVAQLAQLFAEEQRPTHQKIKEALFKLAESYESRGVELKEVASGFRFQAKAEFAPWVQKLWETKPPKYSRAFLETLVLIAYRQPVTRSEVEEVRGVAVNSQIVKSFIERGWVKVLGHRDVPGRPELLGTTKAFLDYFNLKSLDELPTLAELQDLDNMGEQLELTLKMENVESNDTKDETDVQKTEDDSSAESEQLSSGSFAGSTTDEGNRGEPDHIAEAESEETSLSRQVETA